MILFPGIIVKGIIIVTNGRWKMVGILNLSQQPFQKKYIINNRIPVGCNGTLINAVETILRNDTKVAS